MTVPAYLYHYYEARTGPFRSLTQMVPGEDEMLLEAIRRSGMVFASKRTPDYLQIRRELEARVRALFIAKGGKPILHHPHAMTLGPCEWVRSWYRDGRELRIPLADFDVAIISFTYGDMFPAMRLQDGKPTRGQVYTIPELAALIAQFGLPQEVNPKGESGPERYIEAQIWDEAPLLPYAPQST